MPYQLSRISLGIKKIEKKIDIDSTLEINDICYVPDFGVVLVMKKHHCLGLINNKNKIDIPWKGQIGQEGNDYGSDPLFSYPSSICYNPLRKVIYVIENGGKYFKQIEMSTSLVYTSLLLNKIILKSIMPYFDKISNTELFDTSCSSSKHGEFYWCVKELNRCFRFDVDGSNLSSFIGNGRSGFSVSTKLKDNIMNHPSGIVCVENEIYISDTENHCIRKKKNNFLEVASGSPNSENGVWNNPSKICFDNNLFYIRDKTKIKCWQENKDVIDVYESDKMVSFDVDRKKTIIVLEKI